MSSNHDLPQVPNPAEALRAFLNGLLAPAGFRPVVQLLRRKESTAQEDWNPDTDEFRVYFEPIAESAGSSTPAAPSLIPGIRDRSIGEIVHELQKVEASPGHSFVALKWFRDEVLPGKNYPWCQNPDDRQEVLSRAIAEGWILTSKVTNPRQPLYPTTTIRFNRRKSPDEARQTSRFRPVAISGEPLSVTILRDRGTR